MNNMRMLGLLLSATAALAACSPKTPDPSADQAKQGGAPAAAPSPDANPASTAPSTPGLSPGPAATGAARRKAPDGTSVSFTGIKDGDTVSSPFKVGFAITGASIAPAGTTDPGTGHFHLLIDTDLPLQDAPLPASEHVKHYGKGQTEDSLTLPAGTHTLQIELADGSHLPFDPPVLSDKISVTVK